MDTPDRVEHEADDLAGQAKETVGDVTDNRSLQAGGIAEQISANADRSVVDDIREGAGDARHDHQQ